MSTSVLAGTDNCSAYFPKVPYNCVLVKSNNPQLERADFSAFETGTAKASTGTAHNKLRSVSRNTARKLRSQTAEVLN